MVIFALLTDAAHGALANVHPVLWHMVPYWLVIFTALLLTPFTILLPQFLTGKLSWPRQEDVRDVWIIHGKKYNLKPFYDAHPGGTFRLRAAKGSDCTGLFESCHIFIKREVLLQMLSQFEIKDDSVQVLPNDVVYDDDFYRDLKEAVKQYFRGKGKGASKMPTGNLCLSAAAWVVMWLLIWQTVVYGAMWPVPFIGFLNWYMTANVMHDASHNALVTSPRINRICSYAAFPYGPNMASWQIQHVMSHHICTNEEEDVDLYHFDPVITMKKGVGTLPQLVHWLRLVFFLSSSIPHLAFVVPYALVFGQEDPVNGHRMYDRMKAIRAHRAELRWDIIAEMVAQVCFWIVVWWHLGAVKGFLVHWSVWTVCSYLFSFFTLASHLQEECFVTEEELKSLSFAKRQITAAIDFSPASRFWGHISGGLNTQAPHHVFPSISAVHLRGLYPIFRSICKKHGVALKETTSLITFLQGFIQLAN